MACAALGFFSDFAFNGIGKIIWPVVYVPCYIAFAMTLGSYLNRSRYKKWSNQGVVAFLAGTVVIHWILTGLHIQKTFAMSLVSENPIILRSKEFSEALFVNSETLSRKLADDKIKEGLLVATDSLRDYGCIRAFYITSVAGVDIQSDPEARWTLKNQPGEIATGTTGIEESSLPWCWLHFYRP
jgi:hypothetical protein